MYASNSLSGSRPGILIDFSPVPISYLAAAGSSIEILANHVSKNIPSSPRFPCQPGSDRPSATKTSRGSEVLLGKVQPMRPLDRHKVAQSLVRATSTLPKSGKPICIYILTLTQQHQHHHLPLLPPSPHQPQNHQPSPHDPAHNAQHPPLSYPR